MKVTTRDWTHFNSNVWGEYLKSDDNMSYPMTTYSRKPTWNGSALKSKAEDPAKFLDWYDAPEWIFWQLPCENDMPSQWAPERQNWKMDLLSCGKWPHICKRLFIILAFLCHPPHSPGGGSNSSNLVAHKAGVLLVDLTAAYETSLA